MQSYEDIRDELILAADRAGLEILELEETIEIQSLTKTLVLHVAQPGEDERTDPMVAQLCLTDDPVARAATELAEELLDELEDSLDLDQEGEEPAGEEEPGSDGEEPEEAHELEVRFYFPVSQGQDPIELGGKLKALYVQEVDPEYQPSVVIGLALGEEEHVLVDSFLSVGWLLEESEEEDEEGPTLAESVLEEVAQTLDLLVKACRS